MSDTNEKHKLLLYLMILINRLTFTFGAHSAGSPDIIVTCNKKITGKYLCIFFQDIKFSQLH